MAKLLITVTDEEADVMVKVCADADGLTVRQCIEVAGALVQMAGRQIGLEGALEETSKCVMRNSSKRPG